MRDRGLAIALLVFFSTLLACGSPGTPPVRVATEADPSRAEALAREFLIVDTHIDLPYRLQSRPEDVGEATEHGDFDYPRAVAGGLDVAFMSIYVPATYQETGGARAFAHELIDGVDAIVARHPDRFVKVTSVAESLAAADDDVVGLALGIENGAPLEGDLANLREFHDRGVRYITLTHSKDNDICDSSYDARKTWGGLSPFGERLIGAMNDIGMMIDVSHVSDATFEQVLARSRAPVIASHSSCRHFTPGWERNVSDEMLDALAENGGVIQINFGSTFLDGDYQQIRSRHWREVGEHLEREGIPPDSAEAEAFQREYFAARPVPVSTVRRVAEHIDHVVKRVGIDHVGIGSDYDGVGDSLPTGLEDVSKYPNLIAELLAMGYDEPSIDKICGGNLLRVWAEVEAAAVQ